VAVLPIGGQQILQRFLDLGPLAAALVERHVDRDAVEPGAERRPALEAAGLAEQRQEDVLHDLLGVGGRAADAGGDAVHAGGEAVHQRLERRRIAGA
jgi:hypothetical protein